LRLIIFGILLLLVVITGCQTISPTDNPTDNRIEEVENKHGDIKNLERLEAFVNNVKNQSIDKINFIEYGIEGQKGKRTLNYIGNQIKISHSVDGEFIEEYSCKSISVEQAYGEEKYTLVDCKGNFNGDFELLSVPSNNN
jgi:hypothetical protein